MDGLFDGMDFSENISRARFEGDATPLLQQGLAAVDEALREAGVEQGDIRDVLVAGGCSPMPKLRSLLAGRFGASALRDWGRMSPTEAVALGCATQAQILCGAEGAAAGETKGEAKEEASTEVQGRATERPAVALRVGVVTAAGGVETVLCRGQLLPASGELTVNVGAGGVLVTLVEGARPRAADNRPLARFPLLPVDGATEERVLSFKMELDGSLVVTTAEDGDAALVALPGTKEEGVMVGVEDARSAEQVAAVLEDAKAHKPEDAAMRAVGAARRKVEAYSAGLNEYFEDMEEEDSAKVVALQVEMATWLAARACATGGEGLEADTAEVAAITAKLTEMEEKVDVILAEYEEEGGDDDEDDDGETKGDDDDDDLDSDGEMD